MQGTMHWSRLFTRLLTDQVKLVGPTITCQNFLWGMDTKLTANLTTVPHVKFFAMATDEVGASTSLHVVLQHSSLLNERQAKLCLSRVACTGKSA